MTTNLSDLFRVDEIRLKLKNRLPNDSFSKITFKNITVLVGLGNREKSWRDSGFWAKHVRESGIWKHYCGPSPREFRICHQRVPLWTKLLIWCHKYYTYTKLQNCWDIVVFFWHANYISFILLNLKKILRQIPYPLNQCCLTFLFIPKPAIEWTTLSQGREDFKKNSYSQIFARRIPNVPTYFAT